MSLKSLLTFSFVVLLLNGGPVNAVEAPVKVKVNTTHSHSVQDNKKPGESHKVQSNSRNKMKHQMNPAPKTHEEREVFHKQARPLTPMHPAPRTNGKHPQGNVAQPHVQFNQNPKVHTNTGMPTPRNHIEIKNRAMAASGNQANIADVEGLEKYISLSLYDRYSVDDVLSPCQQDCPSGADCTPYTQNSSVPNSRQTFLFCVREYKLNEDYFDFLQYARTNCKNDDAGHCSDATYRRGCKLLLCDESSLTKCLAAHGDSCAGY